MQANEVFKIVLGYGEVLGGKLFLFNAKNNTSQTIKFDKPSGICSAPNSIEEFLTLDYLSFCNPNWASCNTEFHKEAQRSTKYD
jgi:hypothetical protein